MMKTQSRNEMDPTSEQISRIMKDCWEWRFGDFSPNDTWQPPLNVYRLPRRIVVCMSLAGVDKQAIDVSVRHGLLVIRGVRNAPEPKHEPGEPMQIVCMEVDHGPFCRQVRLPDQVDLDAVTWRYEDGLLWIELPIRDDS